MNRKECKLQQAKKIFLILKTNNTQGDNGGPLSQEINGRRIQVGIFSYSHIDGCSEELPVAYERISIYRPWIDSVVPGLP